jgi:precorrin-6B methylase 2
VSTAAAADAAAQALSSRLFRAMLATQESFTAYLGVKLGLYQALLDGGPATVEQLAARTQLAQRYLREWLEQQAGAGLLAVDEPGAPWSRRVYRLPPGHERVLIASADPLSLVSTAMLPLGGVAAALPSLLAAFASGQGVDPEAYGSDWREGHAGANRAIYTELLGAWVRRYLPDVHRRLAQQGGRIADVGCGAGWAAIALARAYPAARVSALDVDPGSVALARQNVARAGLGERITVREADAAEAGAEAGRDEDEGPGCYDLVCLFDAMHELSRPGEVLRACRALAGAGPVVVLDSAASEDFHAPGDEIERFQYATSVLHCLPAGLVGAGAAGVGTVMRPATVHRYAREAGFSRIREYDVGDRFHRLYRLQG